jgi:hypothetical protein
MSRISNISNPFSNLFDINERDIDTLVIKENYSKDNCFVYDNESIIGGFILIKKKNATTILRVAFYRSKQDGKYLPRLEFRKETDNGEPSKSKGNDVIIRFSDGDEASQGFLESNTLSARV